MKQAHFEIHIGILLLSLTIIILACVYCTPGILHNEEFVRIISKLNVSEEYLELQTGTRNNKLSTCFHTKRH